MRLPYLQVTQETWSRARMVAGALGVERHRAMSLLLDLWAWAVDLGRDDEAPTGLVPGTGALPARILAGAVDWTGDAGDLTAALAACGVLDLSDNGAIRVRGMDRYRRTWEKNKRRKPADMVPVTGTSPAGTGEKPAPQTQTQTQMNIRNSPPPRVREDPFGGLHAPEALTQAVVPDRRDGPRPPPGSDIDFFAWAQNRRTEARPGLLPEVPPPTYPDWFKRASEAVSGDVDRLRSAWLWWLKDDWGSKRNPPYAMRAFQSDEVWRKHVPEASTQRATDSPKASKLNRPPRPDIDPEDLEELRRAF